ncbi:hypothetical protein DL95DRAFT_529635 [Leptodontidium sp. 2 PMI_412]|nr:hypothetical protein DL95DRAFT_529635 [Leptodontidium sp. 2 PMI_412]
MEIEQKEEEEERKRIIEEARLKEREREEKEKARVEAERKKWAAEEAAKAKREEEAKKKNDKEIEEELRHRMAKAGYHNEDIEAVVEGKKVNYCHEHRQPYPCGLCKTSTTISSTVSPNSSVYKFRRDHICAETLRHYGLLFEPDPHDETMIVILSDKSRWDDEELLRHSRTHFYYDYHRSVWIRRIEKRRRSHEHHKGSFELRLMRKRHH